jgi:endogenous inhibitor of DNA gyrase (YacG/DUF329 family)
MRMIDVQCTACGHTVVDYLERVDSPLRPFICEVCHQRTVDRVWLGGAPAVHGDEIPGGVWIRHGICHEDGSPRKYYTKSEMARVAKARGLVNKVEHIPSPGSDKNHLHHTQRFV